MLKQNPPIFRHHGISMHLMRIQPSTWALLGFSQCPALPCGAAAPWERRRRPVFWDGRCRCRICRQVKAGTKIRDLRVFQVIFQPTIWGEFYDMTEYTGIYWNYDELDGIGFRESSQYKLSLVSGDNHCLIIHPDQWFQWARKKRSLNARFMALGKARRGLPLQSHWEWPCFKRYIIYIHRTCSMAMWNYIPDYNQIYDQLHYVNTEVS